MSDTETYTARCPRCHQDADWTAVRHTADRGDTPTTTTEHDCPGTDPALDDMRKTPSPRRVKLGRALSQVAPVDGN